MSASDLVSQRRAQADAVGTALAEYLAALPAAAWAGPSDCAGWSVANVVAHLITVQELLGGSVSRGLQGDSGPPPEATDGIEAWPGMWISTLVLLPVGLLLTWKAASDSPLFDSDAYYRGWERFRSLFRRKHAHSATV